MALFRNASDILVVVTSTLCILLFGAITELHAEEVVRVNGKAIELNLSNSNSKEDLELNLKYKKGDNTPYKALLMELDSPPRLVIDVQGPSAFITKRYQNLSKGIKELRLGKNNGAQRIVFEFTTGHTFLLNQLGEGPNGLIASLKVSPPEVTPQVSLPVSPPVSSPLDFTNFLELLDESPYTAINQSIIASPFAKPIVERVAPPLEVPTSTPKNFEPFKGLEETNGVPVWLLLSSLGTLTLLLFLLQLFVKSATKIEIESKAETLIFTEAVNMPSLKEAYRLLGCNTDTPDQELKSRYRHLVKVFHHDTLHPKELPQEILEVSRKEFEKVKAAYNRVQIERPRLQ